jgi:hypothetical protein
MGQERFVRSAWSEMLESGLTGVAMEDRWFSTLTFPFNVSRPVAEKKRNEWLERLEQALKDSGGGDLHWQCVREEQIREVLHYHLVIWGNGLRKLPRERWEQRWKIITGQKKQIGIPILEKNQRIKVIRRRTGSETIVRTEPTYEFNYAKSHWVTRNGSSCKIKSVHHPKGLTNYMSKHIQDGDEVELSSF